MNDCTHIVLIGNDSYYGALSKEQKVLKFQFKLVNIFKTENVINSENEISLRYEYIQPIPRYGHTNIRIE